MATLITIRTIARRAEGTLVQDALGAVALIVMLGAGLHLPVVF